MQLAAVAAACSTSASRRASGVAGGGGGGGSGSAGDLSWTASASGSVTGYRVYHGTSPRVYSQARGAGISVGANLFWTPTGLTGGTRYYFAVTATDGSTESAYSNEITWVV